MATAARPTVRPAATRATRPRFTDRQLALLAERPPLRPWLEHARPDFRWDWPYLVAFQHALTRLTWQVSRRLLVNMPPRHGKSELGTIAYPAYRLRHAPHLRIVIGAYNQTLAERFSRKIRALYLAQGGAISPDRNTAADWETPAGGGVRAVGVGGGITGHGADLIVLDDPIKSRAEAESPTFREATWEWWRNDIRTRLEPGGCVVLTQTRWHLDDLAGRLLASDDEGQWERLVFTAEAEPDDALGRALGAPLCPDRFDAAALAELRRDLGEYAYGALFQQQPRPRAGGLFPFDAWMVLDAAPICASLVRYWDTAGTDVRGADHDPDYTVGALLGRMSDGRFVVLDVARFRKGIAARDAEIVRVARTDHAQHGGRVTQWIETEAGVAGADRTRALLLQLAGVSVRTERPTGNKVVRAEPFASQVQAGNVCLVRGPWNDAFRSELADFPSGTHDDQVDAASAAATKLLAPQTAALSPFLPF